MTINEAAQALNVSSNTIRRRLTTGLLMGKKVDNKWVINVDIDTQDERNLEHPRNAETEPENNPLLRSYEDRIEDLKSELEARRQEISELHQLLAARSLESGAKRPWWRFWR